MSLCFVPNAYLYITVSLSWLS